MRNGFGNNLPMDSLKYNYNLDANGNLLNNQLNYIHDAIGDNNGYTTDLKNQQPNNYTYDSSGNLTSDLRDSIANITWTVYGKINTIIKTNGTVIQYTYNAAGNRVSKAISNSNNNYQEWYAYDASGNLMATYRYTDSLRLVESDMYGSSRVGIIHRKVLLDTATTKNMGDTFSPNGKMVTEESGDKEYELTNHKGDVVVTVSDVKKGVRRTDDTTKVDHYDAIVVHAHDYYPFGMQMPGRLDTSNHNYMFGFNGKQKDDEVKGEGNQIDFGNRVYDPRVGTFSSLDPLQRKYPNESNYIFVGDNPIAFADKDGKDKIYTISVIGKDGTTTVLHYTDKTQFRYLADATYNGGIIYIKQDIYENDVIDLRYNLSKGESQLRKHDITYGTQSYASSATEYLNGNWHSIGNL